MTWDIIPNPHLGFCPLGFIPHTLMVMIIIIDKQNAADNHLEDNHPDFLLLGVVSLLGSANGGRVLSSLKASTCGCHC